MMTRNDRADGQERRGAQSHDDGYPRRGGGRPNIKYWDMLQERVFSRRKRACGWPKKRAF
jgi:hypothetical protein